MCPVCEVKVIFVVRCGRKEKWNLREDSPAGQSDTPPHRAPLARTLPGFGTEPTCGFHSSSLVIHHRISQFLCFLYCRVFCMLQDTVEVQGGVHRSLYSVQIFESPCLRNQVKEDEM